MSLFTFKNNELVLKTTKSDKFLYYYSKVIFSIGEVFLLLEGSYVSDNFKRNALLSENKYVGEIPEFITVHEEMHNFRYFGKYPKELDIRNNFV